MAYLTIPRRFCGPPSSGNGGWTAGALAAHLGDVPATVRLRKPPPLEVELDVALSDEGTDAALLLGTDLVAEATASGVVTPVAPVDLATARAAEADYPGFRAHPFPTCFVCGPDRAEGDGLRIFPGPTGSGLVASSWTPGADVDVATTWAALDCSGGWASDLEARPAVLGTISVALEELPTAGEPHVVVGEERGSEGRRIHTASSLYTAEGRLLGAAEHVWIAVDVSRFS